MTILELCDGLSVSSASEKPAMTQLFEREQNREKNLQARLLALRRLQKQKQTANSNETGTDNSGTVEILLYEL